MLSDLLRISWYKVTKLLNIKIKPLDVNWYIDLCVPCLIPSIWHLATLQSSPYRETKLSPNWVNLFSNDGRFKRDIFCHLRAANNRQTFPSCAIKSGQWPWSWAGGASLPPSRYNLFCHSVWPSLSQSLFLTSSFPPPDQTVEESSRSST